MQVWVKPEKSGRLLVEIATNHRAVHPKQISDFMVTPVVPACKPLTETDHDEPLSATDPTVPDPAQPEPPWHLEMVTERHGQHLNVQGHA